MSLSDSPGMDAKFITLTGVLAAAAFGGVWVMTAPAASGLASLAPTTETASVKSRPHYMVEAPPEDMEPDPLLESDAPQRTTPASARSSAAYSGCNAVRAAGAAPLYRGQPGYRVEMDGDGDGIACEPHR